MSAYSILPTRSPAKYRGKYPARARSVSCGATGVHVELNNGLRLWSYGGKLRELPRVGDDFAAELDAAPAMTAEHYAKLCEAAELSRKAPEGETNAARTIARAEKAAAIRDLLDSILAPVPAPAAPVDSGLFDPMGGLRGTGHIVPETLAERAGLNVRPVMADNGPAFEAAPEVACITVRRNRRLQAEGMAAIAKAEQQAANVESLRVIDMTPTWTGILPTLRALIENGNPEGRRMAWAELEKMARLADERNRMAESFAELAALLPDWPTMRALSAWGAEKATAKKAAARDIIARHIPETISKESSK